jgi:hypothetical protein
VDQGDRVQLPRSIVEPRWFLVTAVALLLAIGVADIATHGDHDQVTLDGTAPLGTAADVEAAVYGKYGVARAADVKDLNCVGETRNSPAACTYKIDGYRCVESLGTAGSRCTAPGRR